MLGVKFERAAVFVKQGGEHYDTVRSWLSRWQDVISISRTDLSFDYADGDPNVMYERYDFVAPSDALMELPAHVVSKFGERLI